MTLLCSKSIHLVILAFKVLHGLAALQLSGFISHVSSLTSATLQFLWTQFCPRTFALAVLSAFLIGLL